MVYYIFLISHLISSQDVKILNARRVNEPPIIDGYIEQVWATGDSAVSFIQKYPKEGEPATEKTIAYLLYDKNNLYVAFTCFDSEPKKINIQVTTRDNAIGDWVGLFLDTFNNKLSGYDFYVNAGNVQEDAHVSSDGRDWDRNWDGVWYSATKITDYGYNVEIKIPFKTLRFDPHITVWGINFSRCIARKHEHVFWAPQTIKNEFRVSRCGILKGINPGQQGLHLEFYPVVLGKYELNTLYPEIGLDINWNLPTSHFAVTTYPDFAQIEADPYTINLSKYELYFPERRPFFIEGREIFDLPIKLFYSRRIGKKIWIDGDVKEIPIIGGAKYTGKVGRTNFGFLSAYTDKVENEPKTLYSVGRLKLGVLKNSELGILYSEARDDTNKQSVAGIDMTFRTTELQIQSQYAHSDKGNGGIVELNWTTSKFFMIGRYSQYDKSFDINRIGFAPWKGRTKYDIELGPQWFNKSIFHELTVAITSGGQKEVGEPKSKYYMGATYSSCFTNNWSTYLSAMKGKDYELNEYYDYYLLQAYLCTDNSKAVVVSCNTSYTSYGYNYCRNYFGPTSQNNLSVEWRISPPLSISLDVSNTIEWKPNKELEAISWVLRPILQYAITKDMHIRIYAEPNTATHIHQFNTLFSYNFRPKSWFYIALNETRDNRNGKMFPSNRIAVIKIRYLFFW